MGLFLKNEAWQPDLGRHLTPMLIEMTDRGPDSAGVALYRDGVPEGWAKVTLFHPDGDFDWAALASDLAGELGAAVRHEVRASHCVLLADRPAETLGHWLTYRHPEVRVMSLGSSIEIYKEKGLPETVARRFGLAGLSGSHAVGHTRMATESAVTTGHSHPFSTGRDLCLVHNGSLSNHNRLRRRLAKQGIAFQTDNDSEVAAGYLSHRLRQGDSLKTALEAAVRDLDGFYTFAVGTRDGFAVLRDPIACKHAVLAETDDWVAMATEYRAIATLPGADQAHIWEPVPGRVYSWEH